MELATSNTQLEHHRLRRTLVRDFELCYSDCSTRAVSIALGCLLSGRSAAWLARLVRDQEAGGSNPLAPTTFTLSYAMGYATLISSATVKNLGPLGPTEQFSDRFPLKSPTSFTTCWRYSS